MAANHLDHLTLLSGLPTVTSYAKRRRTRKVWPPEPCSNLNRHVPSGTFFARLRAGGNLIRKSLETDLLTVANCRK